MEWLVFWYLIQERRAACLHATLHNGDFISPIRTMSVSEFHVGRPKVSVNSPFEAHTCNAETAGQFRVKGHLCDEHARGSSVDRLGGSEWTGRSAQSRITEPISLHNNRDSERGMSRTKEWKPDTGLLQMVFGRVTLGQDTVMLRHGEGRFPRQGSSSPRPCDGWSLPKPGVLGCWGN